METDPVWVLRPLPVQVVLGQGVPVRRRHQTVTKRFLPLEHE